MWKLLIDDEIVNLYLSSVMPLLMLLKLAINDFRGWDVLGVRELLNTESGD